MRFVRRTPKPSIIFLILIAVLFAAFSAGKAAYLTPQLKKFLAPDAAPTDVYGFSVLIEGDWLFVGAPHKDITGNDSGVVYVYERNTGGAENWGYVKTLSASDGAVGDHFGISLDMDGDTLVVGAYFDDDGANVDEGSAYVFQEDFGGAGNWGQVVKLKPDDGMTESLFGISVGISGDTVVIGARENSGGTGGAYVFERNQGGTDAWGLVKKLTALNGESGDSFGDSVAISGDWVAAGARSRNAGAGAAYLFERDAAGPNAWGETKFITSTFSADNIFFGDSVALDGDTLAVSATGLGNGGGVSIYDQNTGGQDNWGLIRTVIETDPELMNGDFGVDIDLDGDVLAVGANLDDTSGSDSGAVYLYQENQGGSGSWGFRQKIIADDAQPGDWFGFNVSTDSDLLLVGAYKDDEFSVCLVIPDCNSGAAYLYDLPGTPPVLDLSIWLPMVINQ